MGALSGEETRRRAVITWAAVFAAVILAFAGTVVALNSTLYSASGFVTSYLDALARKDVAGALGMPGVDPPTGADQTLLTADAMGDLTGYTVIADEDRGQGVHRLRISVHLGDGGPSVQSFTVRHTGPRFGVFSGWKFEQSPLGELQVTPQHDPEFTVNNVTVAGEHGAGQPHPFPVLTPGRFTLGHSSAFLTAGPVTVTVTDPGEPTTATVDVQASDEFVTQVEEELSSYLDDCATQEILFPADCPFGQSIDNRIDGLPAWSMSVYPDIVIVPGDEPDTWVVPPTPASAHLTVGIRSLFDGSLSTFDQDVPFEVAYVITFPGDGKLRITPA